MKATRIYTLLALLMAGGVNLKAQNDFYFTYETATSTSSPSVWPRPIPTLPRATSTIAASICSAFRMPTSPPWCSAPTTPWASAAANWKAFSAARSRFPRHSEAFPTDLHLSDYRDDSQKPTQIRTLFFEVLEIMCIFAQMKNDEVLSRPIWGNC